MEQTITHTSGATYTIDENGKAERSYSFDEVKHVLKHLIGYAEREIDSMHYCLQDVDEEEYRTWLRTAREFLQQGYDILGIEPTCSVLDGHKNCKDENGHYIADRSIYDLGKEP